MTISSFIESLQHYHHPDVFNPWRDYDAACDISPDAPAIRCRQLAAYLTRRIAKARYLFVAEAAGYQGCRFSGIAITCERMLLGQHKQITADMILGQSGQRTSRPDCPYMTSRPQRDAGMNEPTDTYVWGAIVDNGLDPDEVLLWNIFPFHPHKDSPFSNRTPTDEELMQGLAFTKQLLALCQQPMAVAAIGRKAAHMLTDADLTTVLMRHPANGGAGLFRQQFAQWAGHH
ncbi:MAG: uracil-DNA glycosylase [Megasphaera sp.]|jgi:hypothetical protein|nr:uracil-DNA glycosylase [Megasphaera sp.]MCH4188182.1 uracil-DNA glycosylase [Megasphaera sp.]